LYSPVAEIAEDEETGGSQGIRLIDVLGCDQLAGRRNIQCRWPTSC
jgi:hypothetical protein